MQGYTKKVINKLRYLRILNDYSVRDISERTGLAIDTIYKHETGFKVPTLQCALLYSKLYNVEVGYIFELDYGENCE